MYIVDGITYAGDPAPVIRVNGVWPMKDHKLWVRFSTGTANIMDFTPLLKTSAFSPLADEEVFRSVYIDRGITVWNDGEINIAPEYLYGHGVDAEETA